MHEVKESDWKIFRKRAVKDTAGIYQFLYIRKVAQQLSSFLYSLHGQINRAKPIFLLW